MAIQSKNIAPPDRVKVRTALLSVCDKTGIVDFARALSGHGIALVSTGGTHKVLREAGLKVRDVSELTHFPEIMDGRVKTLHPRIHGGLLAIRDDPAHRAALQDHAIEPIDLAVINLYPFEEVCRSGVDYAAIIENIDIGGPAMIRAAAKNHAYVTVITDAVDYGEVSAALNESGGEIPYALRQSLAARAFGRVAVYDGAIANWFAQTLNVDTPRHRSIAGTLKSEMRYGENPHQKAGFYSTGENRPGVATAVQLQGKSLSYNNINDTDAAFELVGEFSPENGPACVIIKHANPCGVALGATLREAYLKALACDSNSAFGGIIALNSLLDASTAQEIVKLFTEVIIAPDASPEARAIIATKPNLRLLITQALPDPRALGLAAKTVAGGFLVQTRDNGRVDDLDLKIVTKRAPSNAELMDMKFAFTVAKHVKSNAVVYAKNGQTIGIGAGQMSRIDSARIAALKAADAAQILGLSEPLTRGCAVASEAFLPFADGLLSVIAAGATSVIQPGGSLRDQEIIDAANQHNIAMVFTGMRHFRH